MSTSELSSQESSDSPNERRAEWERFSMTVVGGDGAGYVNVRNDSHADPSEHIYSVHVKDGSTDGCSCPHAVHRGAHCKHQRAVEQRPLILTSADAVGGQTPRMATDGGEVIGE